MNELRIENLTKTYSNGTKALDNVSLQIGQGMFGLLGPNGAGKSTLMRTIATLQEPDSGSIQLGSLDVSKDRNDIRRVLGYLPQEFGLYPKVSAEVLLNHLAVLKGITNRKQRIEAVQTTLYKTNLYDHRRKNLGSFSGGMKQRFGIAQAIIADPSLIIVDEPTAGLDPAERIRFHNLLNEISEESIVILSTHIVEDVHELCGAMAIINRGQVLLSGDPNATIDQVAGKVYQKYIHRSELTEYRGCFKVLDERLVSGKLLVHIYSEHDPKDGFAPVEGDLSHVYFNQVLSHSPLAS